MAAVESKIPDLSAAWVMEPVAAADWLAILPVALCIVLGAGLMMLRQRTRLHPFVAIPGLALLVVLDALLLWKVAAGGPFTFALGRWLPPFGIAFTVDLLGSLLALAAAVAALAAGVHALADIDGSGRRYGFFPFLMLLMAGVTGAFLTGDMFNLYVWFEVMLISSFGLLVLGSERRQIDGGLKYAVLNLIATTLFLIATGLLYASFGTLNMADIALKAEGLRGSAPLITLSALFMLAFAMKAAAFPLNFWLPASYHTPHVTVSALFAGLLTKVGIYALLRVTVMLLPVEREELSLLVAIVAAATMLTGALGALAETDIRRMLGFVVISGIGAMLAGLAIGGPGGLSGAIFYALHSIIVMTALYLVAGQAARVCGSYCLNDLGGLYRSHAWFAGISLVLFFAAAGLPPFSGLWPKVILVKAALDIGAWWLAGVILVAGFITTIAFGRVFLLAYWRAGAQEQEAAVPVPGWQAALPILAWQAVLPILVLTALVAGFGLFPEKLLRLTQLAASGLEDPQAYIRSVFPQGARP